jgi:hypothetical protein
MTIENRRILYKCNDSGDTETERTPNELVIYVGNENRRNSREKMKTGVK